MPVEYLDEVRQQKLLLGVIRREFVEMVQQMGSGEANNAGVDFVNSLLVGRRDFLFHDGPHAVVIAFDASVTGRVFKVSGQNGCGGARLAVDFDQMNERFRAEKGSVAHQHQYRIAGALFQFFARHHHRVAGAPLLVLLDENKARAGKGFA